MLIDIHITTEDPAQAAAIAKALAAVDPSDSTTDTAKATRSRKKQDAEPAASAPEQPASPLPAAPLPPMTPANAFAAPAPQPATPAPMGYAPQGVYGAMPAAAPTYTLEQLSVACGGLVNAGKSPDLQLLLQQRYGVPMLTQLPQQSYGLFAADIRSMGAAI